MSKISSLQIAPDVLAEINQLSSFLLMIPAHATLKGERTLQGGIPNPKFSASWQEVIEFTASEIVESEKENLPDTVEVRVRAKVDPSTPSGENVGRPFSMRYFVHVPSLQRSGEKSKLRTMTQMSCAKLNQLLKATGLFDGAAGTSLDYGQFFGGDAPAVLGARATVTVRHYVNDGKEYQDASSFAAS